MAKRNIAGKAGAKKIPVKSELAVRIEYPQEGEKLAPPSYTLRVAAPPEAKAVEVSIDGGQWRPCREALGLWWYDWADYANGEHSILARTSIGDGISAGSELRRFTVE